MNYAALADNVEKDCVGDLEDAVIAVPIGTKQRTIGTGNLKEQTHLTGKQKVYAAGRRIGNYLSEMQEKLNIDETKGYNAFVLPVLLLAGTNPAAGIIVGAGLGVYAVYKTRCPAIGMI